MYIEQCNVVVIIKMKQIARISRFCRSAERDFHLLAGPRNVSIDLKYDALCLKCLCAVYLLEMGEVMA